MRLDPLKHSTSRRRMRVWSKRRIQLVVDAAKGMSRSTCQHLHFGFMPSMMAIRGRPGFVFVKKGETSLAMRSLPSVEIQDVQ